MNEAKNEADEICASCGKSECDDIKLKKCNACYLVTYCSVNCQKEHRPQHKRACKKRAAELHDEFLFKQPESSNLGDCPICLLPIPIATASSTIYSCCSKVVCNGCKHANELREEEERLPASCPFCRHPRPKTEEEGLLNQKKRAEANDPVALYNLGMDRFVAGEYATAVEYWEKAAELGDIESHHKLSLRYLQGHGVEKDTKKATHHMERASIGGHVLARYNLGQLEGRKFEFDKAVKHFIIAANLGYDASIEKLKELYAGGFVSKYDFAAALRAYQAAVDATKSPQRDAAEEFRKFRNGGV